MLATVGASSGLGLHTAKVLAKTGNYHVICCVRNEAKMHSVAEKLGIDKDCYSVKEVRETFCSLERRADA